MTHDPSRIQVGKVGTWRLAVRPGPDGAPMVEVARGHRSATPMGVVCPAVARELADLFNRAADMADQTGALK